MKCKTRIPLLLVFLFFVTGFVSAGNTSYNRMKFSFTLSGHMLFGLGYEYGFDEHHAVNLTVFPLLIPGKGLPYALSAGYDYYFKGENWKPKIGAAFTLLVSPPDPDKRKTMPMIVFTPGIQYLSQKDSFLSQIWVAWFLKKARFPVAPIGLEFLYGREM